MTSQMNGKCCTYGTNCYWTFIINEVGVLAICTTSALEIFVQNLGYLKFWVFELFLHNNENKHVAILWEKIYEKKCLRCRESNCRPMCCHYPVESGIQRDACKEWYHDVCINITYEASKCLSKLDGCCCVRNAVGTQTTSHRWPLKLQMILNDTLAGVIDINQTPLALSIHKSMWDHPESAQSRLAYTDQRRKNKIQNGL